ncbi:MAG: hypothetical protein K9H16_07745 [Bacteroidales bacterium]|nr:hypothetical protein [Bacteroidales bacterium]
MENQNIHYNKRRIEIPSLFFDSITGKPFQTCQVCQKQLFDTHSNYIIEKVFRKNFTNGKIESMFEYAICFDCALKLTQSYSKESKENLERFFKENVEENLAQQQQPNLSSEREIMEHLSRCSITGKSVTELDEYQIVGQFNGSYLNPQMTPFMMGNGSMDDVQELLSEKTLDEIDDFTGKYLTGPPEFREFFKVPKRRPILV